ncbi:MAG: EscU/YscU/HrcU family type III secretion system export apparatus switch protein [Bdellovibrionales bacterium]|nr:EscU/YscU/HrcU family type III secretion system export apparatus switch protein [Bdellovibrionales bacterium]
MNRKTKYKSAVALNYDEQANRAPQLAAKGADYVADEIVKLAKRFNIPIKENKELARALTQLELDEDIPEELYKAVAIILNQIDS